MHCKMAASNGGTTLLELLFLKKIVFAYPQNRLELNFTKYLKNKGFIISINDFYVNKNKILKFQKRIQHNKEIDEFGTDRISKIILSYVNKLRL